MKRFAINMIIPLGVFSGLFFLPFIAGSQPGEVEQAQQVQPLEQAQPELSSEAVSGRT